MKYDTIIFDLDGTLIDTSRGIFNSVRYAERMLDLPPVDDVVLRRFVGPPPKSMYTLKALQAKGYHLGVATLKAQNVANKVLSYFSLDQYFDRVIGMNSQENLTKRDTIDLAIAGITAFDKALMVGDSYYDMLGAKDAGVDFLAALFGFGFDSNKPVIEFPCIGNISCFSELIDYL